MRHTADQAFQDHPRVKAHKDLDARWAKKNHQTHYDCKALVKVDARDKPTRLRACRKKSRCHAGVNPHHPRPKQPAKKGGETNYHEISRNHRTRRNGAEPRRLRLEASSGTVAFIRIDRLFQVSPRLRGVSVFKARPSLAGGLAFRFPAHEPAPAQQKAPREMHGS